jgi:hypothetical protein
MKFAVIGPQGRINRVTDTEPRFVAEGMSAQQITDEQAEAVVAGRTATPRVFYVWEEGVFMTLAERTTQRQIARLAAIPVPVPSEVPLWALRQVLIEDDLLGAVLSAVESNAALLNFIEYGNFVDRSSPALAALAAQLQKTSDDLDDLFRRAATKKL